MLTEYLVTLVLVLQKGDWLNIRYDKLYYDSIYKYLPWQPVTAIPDKLTRCRKLGSPVYLESEVKSEVCYIRSYCMDILA